MKKINLIILIIIILVALGLVWYFQNQNTEPGIVDNNNQNTNEPQGIDTSGWETYRNESYSILLPNDFILVKTPLAGESDNLIKPNNISDSNYPNIHISFHFYPSESFNIEKEIEYSRSSLLDRNYRDRDITNQIIDGEEAWVQTGISDSKVENGVVVNGKLNMKDILFVKNSTIFTISLQYEDTNKYIIEKFEKIIDSFKFAD